MVQICLGQKELVDAINIIVCIKTKNILIAEYLNNIFFLCLVKPRCSQSFANIVKSRAKYKCENDNLQ